MTDMTTKRPFYWQGFEKGSEVLADADGRVPPGQVLAALRRGVGREPGSVPEMWPYYTRLGSEGYLKYDLDADPGLVAEHHALALFGLHQQGEPRRLVHCPGIPLGKAVATLAASDRFSAKAVERRFSMAATATDIQEVSHHLRGLIGMFKTVSPTIGFDYTRLFHHFIKWQDPSQRGEARRAWGAAFYWYQPADETTNPTNEKEAK